MKLLPLNGAAEIERRTYMKREELTQKMGELVRLQEELYVRGCLGVGYTSKGRGAHCTKETFIEIADGKSISVKPRPSEEFPFEATVDFDGFIAFCIGAEKDMKYIKNELQEVNDEDNKQSESTKAVS